MPVEFVGTVTDWWFNRNWSSYYWREDFMFVLKEVTPANRGGSALFKNLGGGKSCDITKKAGQDRRALSVGCVFADVFIRGRLDLFVSTDSWLAGAKYTEEQLLKMNKTVEPKLLYINEGTGKFTADRLRVYKSLGHDIVIEDLDHDGLPDIYVGVDAESGNKWATSKGGNSLWVRPNGKTWGEVS